MKNNLREIRMREYISEPAEFAKLLNVNINTYYAWETKYANPSLKEALRVAKILNKHVDEIWSE